jgi:hypothetical protein
MLVWINGAFGSGKTQTTFELLRRAPSAHVADPEEIGFAIHRMLPRAARNDFQNRPQWRSAVVATLADAVRAHDGPVLVPMTLVERAYFDEIMSGLQAAGVDVRHFALIASPETLQLRLRTRSGFWLARATGRQETWAEQQIERCVTALADDGFAEHVDTDDRAIDDVVKDIAARAGLRLERPRLGQARYQLRRAAVGIRHIRI